jgi:arabinofuranosyltransferase
MTASDAKRILAAIARSPAFPAALVLALCALAWWHRFVQDDAFISFRYAANFAAGHGLVFNPGERVEGYTNFLWTLWLAVPFRCGWDPVAFALGSGLLLFAGTLTATFALARRLFREAGVAPLALVLLGTNYTFSCYATGGLETQLQALLFATAAWLTLRGLAREDRLTPGTQWGLALVFTLLLLTRLDSALLVVLFSAVAIATVRGHSQPLAAALQMAGRLGALPLLVVGAWLLWKLHYYGDLLPNTFYIKTAGVSWLRGALYLAGFVACYGLFLLTPACVRAGALRRQVWPAGPRRGLAVLLAASLLWCAYIVKVGGDFMEFRLLVPILPFVFILAAAALVYGIRSRAGRGALLALLLGCTLARPYLPPIPGLSSVRDLAELAATWHTVGEALSALGPATNGVTIATTAAGAIPYYSGLPCVDLLGLADRQIAHKGLPIPPSTRWLGNRPGHSRIAAWAYLQERGVHLLLNHPWIIHGDVRGRSCYTSAELEQWPAFHVALPAAADVAGLQVLEWPLAGDARLILLYVKPHPAIEAAIRKLGVRSFPLAARQR